MSHALMCSQLMVQSLAHRRCTAHAFWEGRKDVEEIKERRGRPVGGWGGWTRSGRGWGWGEGAPDFLCFNPQALFQMSAAAFT